ncbi:MAG: hypothetical protein V5A29_11085 [Haloarculaceae archaeon]
MNTVAVAVFDVISVRNTTTVATISTTTSTDTPAIPASHRAMTVSNPLAWNPFARENPGQQEDSPRDARRVTPVQEELPILVIDGNDEQEDATDDGNDRVRDCWKEWLQDERSQEPPGSNEDEDGQHPTFTARDRPENLALSPDDCLGTVIERKFRTDELRGRRFDVGPAR